MSEREERHFGIPKLHGPQDFVNWRLLAKFSMEADDYQLLWLTERPKNATATALRKWEELNAKAKRTIVCSLGAKPLARFNSLIGTGTAKLLWEELNKTYNISHSQAITNLQQYLKKLTYEEVEDWPKHLNCFHQILALLNTYGEPIDSDGRTKKLIRTFPPSLSPIFMTAEATKMDFETLVENVESDMSLRANHKGSSSNMPRPSASKAETPGGTRI